MGALNTRPRAGGDAQPGGESQGSHPEGEPKPSNQRLPKEEFIPSNHGSDPKGESTRTSSSASPVIIENAGVSTLVGDQSHDGEPNVDPMDLIPIAVRRDFISQEASSLISKNPREAVTGIEVYKGMLREGKIKIYKQKMTGMDIQTLKRLLNTIKQDWNIRTNIFNELTENIACGKWKQNVEKIEMSSKKSECLFYNLQYDKSNEKYHIALCYIITDSTLSDSVVVGGLLSECLLAKDENRKLYLQL